MDFLVNYFPKNLKDVFSTLLINILSTRTVLLNIFFYLRKYGDIFQQLEMVLHIKGNLKTRTSLIFVKFENI